jgi:hypothetical protein
VALPDRKYQGRLRTATDNPLLRRSSGRRDARGPVIHRATRRKRSRRGSRCYTCCKNTRHPIAAAGKIQRHLGRQASGSGTVACTRNIGARAMMRAASRRGPRSAAAARSGPTASGVAIRAKCPREISTPLHPTSLRRSDPEPAADRRKQRRAPCLAGPLSSVVVVIVTVTETAELLQK